MSLNKAPQDVANGSIVFAKNVRLTDDGFAITNDDGFVEVISKDAVVGRLVGFISCAEEIVIFSHEDDKNKSHIYRLKEINNTADTQLVEVFSAWTYSKGVIKGTYMYNVNKELIISIAESNGNKKVPLKTINLDRSNSGDLEAQYEVAPRIPIANLRLVSKDYGSSMPQGLYYFFIRYEIADNVYTKWFPIGIPHYALNVKNKVLIDHHYQYGSNDHAPLYTKVIGAYNSNSDCAYNFKFNLNLNKTYSYKNYQIGYILQHNEKTVARIWRTFSCSVNNIFIFDAKGIKEEDINTFTDNVFNLYNVETIANYENRLYIANFEESNYNEDLISYANEVNSYLHLREYNKGKKDVTEQDVLVATFNGKHTNYSLEVPTNTDFIRIWDYPGLVAFFQAEFDYHFNANCLANHWYDDNRIELRDVYLSLKNNEVVFYNNKHENVTTYESDGKYICIEYPTGEDENSSDYYIDPYIPIYVGRNQITISTDTNKNYTSYSYVDNTVRTLLPDNVYNFFIHYVREDGSFTNGIPLKNKASAKVNEYIDIVLKNGVKSETTNIQVGNTKSVRFNKETESDSSVSDISYFKDKHVYEILSNTLKIASGTCRFGYYTNYNDDKLFVTGSSFDIDNKDYIINTPCFNNIRIPNGFVGFFISYEKPENLIVCSVKCIDAEKGYFKASDVEVALNNFVGSIYHSYCKSDDAGKLDKVEEDNTYFGYIKNASIVMSNVVSNVDDLKLNATGREGIIYLDIRNYKGEKYKITKDSIGYIKIFNRNIYCSKHKTLIPLGPVVAGNNTNYYAYGEHTVEGDVDENGDIIINYGPGSVEYLNPVINEDYNLPAFITNDKYLQYTRPIYINDGECKVFDIDDNNNIAHDPTTNIEYYAKFVTVPKFCNYNLDAITIKREPEIIVGLIGDTSRPDHAKYVNTIVKPINATDLIEYKKDFIESYPKVYTEYDEAKRSKSIKKSVIRRSNIIKNESVENSWRIFEANNYKVIDSGKGNITNLVGAATVLYVHTEHTLLALDKNNVLKTENQEINLVTPDLFDIEPKELFTAQHGFGGLQNRDAYCVNHIGYWFYDAANKRVYCYNGQKLIDISIDIINWLNSREILDARFMTDFKTNRVLICFKFKTNDIKEDYATFSFNLNTNKYTSTHDYYFTESINTKNNVYFFDSILKNTIYVYNKNNIGDYKLLSNNSLGFPDNHEVVKVKTKDDKVEHRVIQSSVIDIMFNSEYGLPRLLESIDYILDKKIAYDDVTLSRQAEPFTNDGTWNETKRYSGDVLRIYTDQTDTGNLDIHQPGEVNMLNSYKVPHYERGIWQLNYFRNYLNFRDIDKELMIKLGIKTLQDLSPQQLKRYNEIKANYNFSDNRSIIYGKYIVLRFIFRHIDDRRPFILNDVSVNIKPY